MSIKPPRYVLVKRGNRLVLEYSLDRVRVRYASCNINYEPYIKLLAKDLNDIIQVMRIYIAMKLIPYAKGGEAYLIDLIREMPDYEVLFWYVKLSKFNRKAISAFKKLYLE